MLKALFAKHQISDSEVLDITKKPNFRVANHASTSFDRSYFQPGDVHQIDTLHLPTDAKGDKFLLVVVDIGSGKMDCRPLPNITAIATLEKLKDIYGMNGKKKNKVFSKPPKKIHSDQGTEFNNVAVKDFFHSKNIGIRFSSTGRHSQQAIVERMNLAIGDAIMKLQLHNENVSGLEDKDWVDYLPDIVKAVNDHVLASKPRLEKQDDSADVKCNGSECDILEVGAQVRVALDYPTDVNGTRIYGKFRAGDRRFSLKPHTVENVLMFPNQPIRYVISGIKNNTFSKAELLPYVAPKGMKLTKGMFLMDRIVDKKKEKNRILYHVKWEGYDELSWEPRTKLLEDGKLQFIRDFEKFKK